METEFVNKVANSGIISLNLEDFYHKGERVTFDIKDQLFRGLILKEKDFREFIKDHDWSVYQDKNVSIICSADAIVPTWAYMLLAVKISPYANHFVFGDMDVLEASLYQKMISSIEPEQYRDQRVVVKGCGDLPVPTSAYVEITRFLAPIAKSIMYGEPCSTVPIYKKAKA